MFDGIGKMEDKKRGKEISYYLQEQLKKWLDQGLAGDTFEKVPDDEPVTWCSPVVVQLKPKFADIPPKNLEPNTIRASVRKK